MLHTVILKAKLGTRQIVFVASVSPRHVANASRVTAVLFITLLRPSSPFCVKRHTKFSFLLGRKCDVLFILISPFA